MDRYRGGGGERHAAKPDPHHHYNSTKYSKAAGAHLPPPPPPSRSSSDSDRHRYSHRWSPNYDYNNNHGNSYNDINDTPPPPNDYRGGADRDVRDRDLRRSSFHSPPPRRHPSPVGTGEEHSLRPPMRAGGRVSEPDHIGGGFSAMSPLSGQKRGLSSFSDDIRDPPPPPPDRFDGAGFAKLFVGNVPRTATEEDIRPLFNKHGRVLEVALIKDKRTGQQQGCCFIKYATSQDADRAIRSLHNQYTLPGGVGPIQVRYADGEQERLGAAEIKLFVGLLNKSATEKEVEEIFAPYGQIEDVYLMRDEMKRSRGCGFVKYAVREMALAAINALNGTYVMRGCDHPLIVRFADPKKPRLGESRGGTPVFGGPGFGPQFPPPGIRPGTVLGEPLHDRFPTNALQPMSPQKPGPHFASGMHGFGNHLYSTSADSPVASMPGSILGRSGSSTNSLLPGFTVSSASTPQLLPPNVAPAAHPLLRPVSQVQMPSSAGQTPDQVLLSKQSPGLGRQLSVSQPQFPDQVLPSKQSPGLVMQLSVSQPELPLNTSSAVGQASPLSNLQPHVMSAIAYQQQLPAQQQLHQQQLPAQQQLHQQQLPPQQQLHQQLPPQQQLHQQQFPPQEQLHQQQLPAQQQSLQPLLQSPSQLAQLLSQQTQAIQASFQSSQQAFSQLQQQLQLMQPSNQSSISQQGLHLQSSRNQSPWAGTVPQTAANPVLPGGDVPTATSGNLSTPVMTRAVASGKCSWTEHTSPDGYKYYYNSATGESKWEKPEELVLYEQQQFQQLAQQPKPPLQHLQVRHPQSEPVRNVPQRQIQIQNQIQTQLQSQNHPQQLQQSSHSLLYQGPGATLHQTFQESRYPGLTVIAGSNPMNDPTQFQQGQQPAKDWMWKNKPAGM